MQLIFGNVLAGWQLGSDPEIQVATVISNHLTAGIMKYFGDAYRLQHAANLFEKLVDKEPEVAALLARSYIGMSTSSQCFREMTFELTWKSQMRRSRPFRSSQLRCIRILNLTICYTHNAISSDRKAEESGH
jgi:hypothetical protein